ncbi:MAG: hypothetical protein HQK51_01960, partial [Oligoflexia bacterium]|nr:hypothetical protein [Oligoflexia bacterium]
GPGPRPHQPGPVVRPGPGPRPHHPGPVVNPRPGYRIPHNRPWDSGYRHSPYTPDYHNNHYSRSWDYFSTISYDRRFVYRSRWILERAWSDLMSYVGYYTWNNYPYYVYNGYMYRYSSADYCQYDLIDQYQEQDQDYPIETYEGYCNVAYDQCAEARDSYNYQENDYRYVCAETYQEQY